MTHTTIKNIFSFSHEAEEFNPDPLIQAELQLSRAEFQYLLNRYGNKIITSDTIKPFHLFLLNRWKRIAKTDLIYPHAHNQPATRLCIQIAKAIAPHTCSINQVIHNKHSDKKRLVYSLLMPTVDFSYHLKVPISEISLDKFILTDDDNDFIPVAKMMIEAGSKGSFEFLTPTLRSNYRYGTRILTKSEQERLLSHSTEVNEYYQAIKKSNALKSANVYEILEKIFNDDLLKDTSMMRNILIYLESLDVNQKNKLYAMQAYCVHTCKNSTFKDVIDYFGEGKSRIKAAHVNMDLFLQRHKFTLIQEKQIYVDPLILATPKFSDAMKNPVEAKPTYGNTARQQLINQLYNDTTLLSAVQIMHDAEQLADYLQAMPVEKKLTFLQLLSAEKLQDLFNEPSEDDIHLARIWYHLAPSQKKYLFETMENHERLTNILNRQTHQDKKADCKIAIEYLATIFRSDVENNKTVQHLLTQINRVSERVSISELHFLTELVHRSALRLDKPYHITNNLRYTNLVKSIKEYSWGQIVLDKIAHIYHVGLKIMGIVTENSNPITAKGYIKLPTLAYNFFTRSALRDILPAREFVNNNTPLLSRK